LAYEIYGKEIVYERHRHRYEVNAKYIDLLESGGLTISGWSIDGFPEIIELNDSSFYLGIQAHPEFRSRPLNPSPIYVKFLERAALSTRQ
ncbi:MAG: CTP synthetase, partial [Desulfurococcaceae archaeon]